MELKPKMAPAGPVPDFWRTWVEINPWRLRQNALVAAQYLPSGKLMAVVKADAYGHGADLVSQALRGMVANFGVANVTEAEALRAAGVEEPIFLLSPCLPSERESAVAGNFIPSVSSLEEARDYDQLAARFGRKLAVALTIDTGMGRIGFLPDEILAAAAELGSMRHLRLESIASHFPSADEDACFTRSQAARFEQILAELKNRGLDPDFVHVANSAGLLGYPRREQEIARVGLMLYGVSPLAAFQEKLEPVLTWKARVTLVRELPPGWGVSYGRTFITKRPTQVATLAVGYADGYHRALSGKGAAVLLHGCRCPLLGRVTMDQIMVDVTDLPCLPVPGDEAVLLGRQGVETISAVELAQLAGTIPYEIFTSIGRRVRRIALPEAPSA